MAKQFILIDKITNEETHFALVDTKVRKTLHARPHSKKHYKRWYDLIAYGFMFEDATFNSLKKQFPQLIEIINYIEAHYEVQVKGD